MPAGKTWMMIWMIRSYQTDLRGRGGEGRGLIRSSCDMGTQKYPRGYEHIPDQGQAKLISRKRDKDNKDFIPSTLCHNMNIAIVRRAYPCWVVEEGPRGRMK